MGIERDGPPPPPPPPPANPPPPPTPTPHTPPPPPPPPPPSRENLLGHISSTHSSTQSHPMPHSPALKSKEDEHSYPPPLCGFFGSRVSAWWSKNQMTEKKSVRNVPFPVQFVLQYGRPYEPAKVRQPATLTVFIVIWKYVRFENCMYVG